MVPPPTASRGLLQGRFSLAQISNMGATGRPHQALPGVLREETVTLVWHSCGSGVFSQLREEAGWQSVFSILPQPPSPVAWVVGNK